MSLSAAGPHRTVKYSLEFIVVRQQRQKSLAQDVIAL